ncbi:hypothetical protein [Conexivisphaera calida]|uniref:Uncharacterized protein n=1 Tax=Conexivisphaera calida TaxID=1874277 RepID=A0A4V0P1P8_9ARCH|nr:hypothetical protein [Conexivisphaera calida]BBE42470.1 hypothetical protein NAS2_1081 [Conexivisphaera calida]
MEPESESEEKLTPREEFERREIDPRGVLEAVRPFVRRVAVLSVPLMNARVPVFAAALPMDVGMGPWLGGYVRGLASEGVSVENYVAHPPTLAALERILGYEFPIVGRGEDGAPVRFIRGKYVAGHNELQVSLVIKQRVEERRALAPEEIDALVRDGKVALAVIYYY